MIDPTILHACHRAILELACARANRPNIYSGYLGGDGRRRAAERQRLAMEAVIALADRIGGKT